MLVNGFVLLHDHLRLYSKSTLTGVLKLAATSQAQQSFSYT